MLATQVDIFATQVDIFATQIRYISLREIRYKTYGLSIYFRFAKMWTTSYILYPISYYYYYPYTYTL